MKKLALVLLIFTSMFFTACPGPEEEQQSGGESNKTQTKSINMQSAKDFMDNYMRYVVKMDTDVMRSFYTTKLRERIKEVPKGTGPHPVGYKVGEGEGKGEGAEFTVNIFNSSDETPYYSIDTYKYKLVTEDGKMLIDDISKDKVIEVLEKGTALIMREGDKIEGKYILSTDEFPNYASPQVAPEKKLSVSKNGFGPCALSPDEKSLVVTSKGKNSLIAIGEFQEEQSTMKQQGGQGGGGGQKKSGGGEGEGKEGGGQGGEEEKDLSKEVLPKAKIKLNPIDVYIDVKTNIISFSPDGKTFVIQSTLSSGLSNLKIYKTEKGEAVKTYRITNNFRSDRFSLTNPYFTSPEELNFTVTAISGAQDEEKALEGDWIYDVKKDELKKGK